MEEEEERRNAKNCTANRYLWFPSSLVAKRESRSHNEKNTPKKNPLTRFRPLDPFLLLRPDTIFMVSQISELGARKLRDFPPFSRLGRRRRESSP